MEKLIREYQEGDQLMQEFEITSPSGRIHLVRKPVPQEPTTEHLAEQIKQKYLQLIRDAQDLGETEDVLRLQAEYQIKKSEITE